MPTPLELFIDELSAQSRQDAVELNQERELLNLERTERRNQAELNVLNSPITPDPDELGAFLARARLGEDVSSQLNAASNRKKLEVLTRANAVIDSDIAGRLGTVIVNAQKRARDTSKRTANLAQLNETGLLRLLRTAPLLASERTRIVESKPGTLERASAGRGASGTGVLEIGEGGLDISGAGRVGTATQTPFVPTFQQAPDIQRLLDPDEALSTRIAEISRFIDVPENIVRAQLEHETADAREASQKAARQAISDERGRIDQFLQEAVAIAANPPLASAFDPDSPSVQFGEAIRLAEQRTDLIEDVRDDIAKKEKAMIRDLNTIINKDFDAAADITPEELKKVVQQYLARKRSLTGILGGEITIQDFGLTEEQTEALRDALTEGF